MSAKQLTDSQKVAILQAHRVHLIQQAQATLAEQRVHTVCGRVLAELGLEEGKWVVDLDSLTLIEVPAKPPAA